MAARSQHVTRLGSDISISLSVASGSTRLNAQLSHLVDVVGHDYDGQLGFVVVAYNGARGVVITMAVDVVGEKAFENVGQRRGCDEPEDQWDESSCAMGRAHHARSMDLSLPALDCPKFLVEGR